MFGKLRYEYRNVWCHICILLSLRLGFGTNPTAALNRRGAALKDQFSPAKVPDLLFPTVPISCGATLGARFEWSLYALHLTVKWILPEVCRLDGEPSSKPPDNKFLAPFDI